MTGLKEKGIRSNQQIMQNELIIYKTDDGKADVKLCSKDGIVWMNQQQPGAVF